MNEAVHVKIDLQIGIDEYWRAMIDYPDGCNQGHKNLDGSRCNTMWPGPRPTFVPSGILIHPPFDHNMGRKLEERLCPVVVELGSHLTQSGSGRGLPPHQVASWSIETFGHNRYGPKFGGLPFFGRGSWVPIHHSVAWAEAYLHTKWQFDPSSRLPQ